jgi:hypothetical protein
MALRFAYLATLIAASLALIVAEVGEQRSGVELLIVEPGQVTSSNRCSLGTAATVIVAIFGQYILDSAGAILRL